MTGATPPVIAIDRVIDASPATVFRAISHPELLSQWLGPEGTSCTVDELEFTVGGRLAFTIAFADGSAVQLHGYYEDIIENRRVLHSWAQLDDVDISTIVWSLEPEGDGTRLRLEHHGLTAPEDVQRNEAGWAHLLDRLAAVVED